MNLDHEIDRVGARLTDAATAVRLRERVLLRLEPRARRRVVSVTPIAAAVALVIGIGLTTRLSPPAPARPARPAASSPRVESAEPVAAVPATSRSRAAAARIESIATSAAPVVDVPPLPTSAPPALELANIQPRDLDLTVLAIEAITTEPLRVEAIDMAHEVIDPSPRGIS